MRYGPSGLSDGELLTGYKTAEEIADYGLSKGVKDVVIKAGKEGAYVRNSEICGNIIGGLQLTLEGDNEGLPDREQLAEALKRGLS